MNGAFIQGENRWESSSFPPLQERRNLSVTSTYPQLRAVAHRIVHDMSRAEDVIHEAFAQIAPGRFHLLARPFEKLLAPLGIIRSLSFPNAILGVLLVVPEATRT
jgi:hypothetical protein